MSSEQTLEYLSSQVIAGQCELTEFLQEMQNVTAMIICFNKPGAMRRLQFFNRLLIETETRLSKHYRLTDDERKKIDAASKAMVAGIRKAADRF